MPNEGQFFWLQPPYIDVTRIEREDLTRADSEPGSCVVWRVSPSQVGEGVDQVRIRTPGVALVVVLPPAAAPLEVDAVLDIVERCRPQSILPFHPLLDLEEIATVLRRPPDDLAGEVTEYLRWRGLAMDLDTRRTVRRIIELSGELRTVSALARSLYISRRALGRRFLSQGLPVPSHWLQIGRLLRAAIQLQNGQDNLFSIACALGYPDGFSLSNQMKRLTGVRPSTARDALGWEWFLEAWLVQERAAGSLTRRMVVGAHH